MEDYDNSFVLPMTEEARKLDKCLKEGKDFLDSKYPKLTLQKKLRLDQIPGEVGACEPDGGLWFRGDTLVAVFEAKTQGDNSGNALERWYKNHYICRMINPDVCYVTFCRGINRGYDYMVKTLHVSHLDGYNTFIPYGNTCHIRKAPESFTNNEVLDKMKEVLDYVSK